MNLEDKEYVAVVQCELSTDKCNGYQCEKAFHERSGGFAQYPKDRHYRTLHIDCGGCDGRQVHRKLMHLVKTLKKKEKIEKDKIVVHFSSCITRESHHGPKCPYVDDMRKWVAEDLGLDVLDNTHISPLAVKAREKGKYGGPA